jgi:LysM repeat protein
MTVRNLFAAGAACAVLLLGACNRENSTLGAETDDPLFAQGKQLEKLNRHSEALTLFLQLIDKRGERSAPESHLEAGLIYLNHTKDPVEACHHFRKYLELQPNSKEAQGVRGMVDAARREFARTLSVRPLEDQAVRLEITEEVTKLRRENDELRAELAARRGVAPLPVRSAGFVMPEVAGSSKTGAAEPPVNKVVDSLIMPAPATSAPPNSLIQPVRSASQQQATMTPASATPVRPGTKSGGRTHTVGQGDTLYRLSKQYNVTVEDIAAANGMKVNAPLKLGTVLKIPGAAAPATGAKR